MKKNLVKMNFLLLIFMIIYTIFGLVMILSASSVAAVLRYDVAPNFFFMKQLLFSSIAYVLGIIILFIPTKSRIYRYLYKFFMYGIIALLVLLFFSGIVVGGAQSWYDFGVAKFQPTEFAKLAIILYFAYYYYQLSKKKEITFINMIWPIIISAVVFVLVALQPDLGGAMIILIITGLIFFGLPIGKEQKRKVYKIVGIGLVILGLSVLLLGKSLLKSYQLNRIINYQNPCQRYTDESGYQVCNGYIAIDNGGLFGVGPGKSVQKYMYLPASHTDFIFPIVVEELGTIVGVVIILAYMFLIGLVFKVALNTKNLQNSIICYGIGIYFMLHIFVNLGGVLGIIPLTGVPLPFLSYGGSFCITIICSFAIVQRIHIENEIERHKNA